MSKANEPAFPGEWLSRDSMGDMTIRESYPGMTLRQWYKGQIASNLEGTWPGLSFPDNANQIAKNISVLADALLAEDEAFAERSK
jgi:hypothetical protein